MKPMHPATRTLFVLTAAVLQTLPALADGHHTGWCQGVHNPHNNYGCTGGNHYSGDHHDHTPDVTPNGGNVQPGTTQGPSPQTVTVTGDTGTPVVDPQNNPGAVTQQPTTTTQTQAVPTIEIHRPHPQPVVGPPQTTVYNPPGSGATSTSQLPPQGPRFVDGPLMQQAPSLPPTRTPTQTPQMQAVPPLSTAQRLPVIPPQPPSRPPAQIPVPTQIQAPPQGPHFVDGPLMQQAPSLPPTRIPTQVPQVQSVPPLTVSVQGPAVQTPQPPVIAPPQQTQRPPVITAQPQVPVTTSNPAIPLAQQQPVVTSTPQPLAQPTLPTLTGGNNPPSVAVPPSLQTKPPVITAQPQVPVTTSNPSIPLAQQQPVVTSTPQPIAQPPLQTVSTGNNRPPVAIPPGQQPKPPVITAQPQVPVTTSNPAIPLAQQQPVVTSTPQTLAQPTLPTLTTGNNQPPVAIPTGQQPKPPVITAQPQVPITTSNPAIPLALRPPVTTSTPQPLAQPQLPPTVVTAQPPVAIPPVRQPGPAQVLAQPPITIAQTTPGAGQTPTAVTPTPHIGTTIPSTAGNGPGNPPGDPRTGDNGTPVLVVSGVPASAAVSAGGRAWVVPGLGRQLAHQLPTRTEPVDDATPIHCVASGFGLRRAKKADGSWEITGLHEHLRTTESVIRNIPANHHRDAGCLIEVRRRVPASG